MVLVALENVRAESEQELAFALRLIWAMARNFAGTMRNLTFFILYQGTWIAV
ncbi:hypothetical protein [Oscillatoria sp. CS-180]|uniref:hypothetical protein n=1 Tax=Oscillatoria sp. CS-180 TaxID=3021720 RepID=UPI00232AB9AC|nr:hypothetical protein [Oscillatoria sp. CS-180]